MFQSKSTGYTREPLEWSKVAALVKKSKTEKRKQAEKVTLHRTYSKNKRTKWIVQSRSSSNKIHTTKQHRFLDHNGAYFGKQLHCCYMCKATE